MVDPRELWRQHEKKLWQFIVSGMEDALFSEEGPREVRWHWCDKHNMEMTVNCGYYSMCPECVRETWPERGSGDGGPLLACGDEEC